ncbi:MAG: VCBS repeat-containing protein [Myxococcota bacterium]
MLGLAGCTGAGLILPGAPIDDTSPPSMSAPTGETAEPVVVPECGDRIAAAGELCFGPLVTAPAPGPGSRIDAGDLNADGHPDLVTVSTEASGVLAAFVNDGTGGFSVASSTALRGSDVRFLQADTDGVPDLFVAGVPFRGNAVIFGDGDALLPAEPDTYYYWNTIRRAVPVDWNDDGATDIAVVVPANGDAMQVGFDLSQPGQTISDGGFVPVSSTDACTGGDVLAGDFARTGVAHGVVACGPQSTVTVYRYADDTGPYETGLQVGTAVSVDSAPVALAACDLDQDDDDDIVVAGPGGVTVLANNGSARLSAIDAWAAGDLVVAIACADLDFDGFPDVATLEDGPAGGEGIRIRRGRGDLTLDGQSETIGLGPQEHDPTAFVVTDLDGDDALDFALSFGFVDPEVPAPIIGIVLADP